MTHPGPTPRWSRLDAALFTLATTFHGMTAHPDEYNCECHWGSAEELALLKVPDVELTADLLRRTWVAPDWSDRPAVLRRILPQLASALVRGSVEAHDLAEVGESLARCRWRRWPADQATAVQEFLDAWWASSLTSPDPAVPAHAALVLCCEASGTLTPWLTAWAAAAHPVADQCLAEAVAHWADDLLRDRLPWDSCWSSQEQKLTELVGWLIRHAPARLRAHGAAERLLHTIRLLGLAGPDRWTDPHWPDRHR